MNKRKNILIIIVTLILISGASIFIFQSKNSSKGLSPRVLSGEVKNFYDCQSRGFPSTTEYPRQCKLPDGTIFFEDLHPNAPTSTEAASYKDLIKLSNLVPNQAIKSPFILKGSARGSWYFEGSFPFKLLDSQGNVLTNGQAKAESEWATSSYVSFTATLNFNIADNQFGEIVLSKDNPSGDPIRDDSWTIPVRLEK